MLLAAVEDGDACVVLVLSEVGCLGAGCMLDEVVGLVDVLLDVCCAGAVVCGTAELFFPIFDPFTGSEEL